MKPLPTKWKKKGAEYTVLLREHDVVMVELKRDGRTFYEVAHVQSHGGYTIAGVTMLAAEHMPRTEQWGTFGWSYADRPSAMAKFNDRVEITATLIAQHRQDSARQPKRV